jgi:GNAT superfamily N-acetyltransferase
MTAAYPAGHAARRAFTVLHDEGFASFCFKGLSELGYRRLLLLERYPTPTEPQVARRLSLCIEMLEISDVDRYVAFRPETTRARILHRLRSAQACFVARHEGRIIAACWSATRPAWSEFLRREIGVAEGDVYLFDAFTLAACRGRGISPALCVQQLRHFRQLGLQRAIRATLPENAPALHAHAKTGFRRYALRPSSGAMCR